MVREFRETRAKKLFFWLAKISLLKPKAKFSRATFFESRIKKFSERKQSMTCTEKSRIDSALSMEIKSLMQDT